MGSKKTDNDYTGDKIAIRINHSPWPVGRALRVLDCFGGHGVVWRGVEKKAGKKIDRVAIDERIDLQSFHLHGDNAKILMNIDLQHYDVIDLDAYGIPFEQLKIIFDRGYQGTVFVTAIQTMMGMLPKKLLAAVGFTEAMQEKAPTLISRRGFKYFIEWLAAMGIKSYTHRSKHRKHYITFCIEACAADCNNRPANTFANPV